MRARYLAPILAVVVFAAGGHARAAVPNPATDAAPPKEVKGTGIRVAGQPVTPGETLYNEHCAECHAGQVAKAPSTTFLQLMPPDSVLASMTDGIMKREARKLNEAQKVQVTEYLFGKPMSEIKPPLPLPQCTGAAANFDLSRPPQLRGWGFDVSNTRRIPEDVAGLAPADIPRLKLKWAFAYPGAMRARSQPTFAMGALFVGSQDGTVYALDAATGCLRWKFRATAEVRVPVEIMTWSAGSPPSPPLVFFGDLIGRVYAVDALTGKMRWVIKADEHPAATITAPPVYHEGRLYVAVSSLEEASAPDPTYPCCTFRGSVLAIDAATGRIVWQSYTIPEQARQVGKTKPGTAIMGPSGAPIWAALSIDTKRRLIYAATGNNYSPPAEGHSDAIIAFDLATGAMRWTYQTYKDDIWNVACMVNGENCPEDNGPDYDIGAGSLLVTTKSGKDVLLVGRKDGTALALDPDRPSEPLWSRKIGRGSIQGGVLWGMTGDPGRVYVPISDMADSGDSKVYTEPAKGGLYALDALTGESLWSSPADDICKGERACDPGIAAAITSIPGAVLAGHMDGRIRIYDDATGKVLWEYNSRQEVVTLSGERARGGSVSGPGPVVHGGIVYVNSGYGLYFHLPGNVLLAFSVDGR